MGIACSEKAQQQETFRFNRRLRAMVPMELETGVGLKASGVYLKQTSNRSDQLHITLEITFPISINIGRRTRSMLPKSSKASHRISGRFRQPQSQRSSVALHE